MALAASYPFRRIAAADYCCEHQIARDRDEVLDRISRTVATNRECRERATDLGIIERLMPVLQGRRPEDYSRCAEALHLSMLPGTVVGIGSMCRRDIHGPEGLIAVVRHLDSVLPTGIRLHLFGVKGSALPWLLPFAHRVASIDSQAWGTAARREAHRTGRSKTDCSPQTIWSGGQPLSSHASKNSHIMRQRLYRSPSQGRALTRGFVQSRVPAPRPGT